MALAQVGPATGFMEALATSVGAGMVLGGFLIGSAGTMMGWPRAKLEALTLPSGYIGGAFAGPLALIDLTMR